MLKIALCDDNSDFLQLLETKIESFMDTTDFEYSINSFNSLESLELHLKTRETDIVFLDIMFGEENSAEWVKSIIVSSKTQIIFMTSFPEEAYAISEVQHTYFIIKSKIAESGSSGEIINNALSKAIKLIANNEQKLAIIKTKDERCVLDYDKIVFIEGINNHIMIQMEDGESLLIYSTLSKFSEQLPVSFLRCHKSFIVNMNYISSFKPNFFIMKDSSYIMIPSKKYKSTVKRFERYIKFLGRD